MSIIQEAFDIPDDIAIGIASGLYRRIGGVVRYASGEHKGQIVKHLKPVIVPKDSNAALEFAEKAIEFGRNHKKLMVGAAVVAGVATASGGIAAGISIHKKKKFQKIFKRYINAIRSGNVDVEMIEELEDSLSNMNTVKLKANELSILVGHIRSYTMKLASDNGMAIEIKETTDSPIIDLREYLRIQKKILKAA